MRASGKFSSLLKSLKRPTCTDSMFIVVYPGLRRRCATLHRDFVDSHMYSVFFLLTRVTMDNGAVKIYLNSTKWERDPKQSTAEQLKKYERKLGKFPFHEVMMGDPCDLFAFDGRLLHQSSPNSSQDVRIVFAFTLYDAAKINYKT